jgi:H+/Cl- antiporter ClcA
MSRIRTWFLWWIGILIFELLGFYNFIHQVHDQEELHFYILMIVITLIVGAVGLIVTAITNRNDSNFRNR